MKITRGGWLIQGITTHVKCLKLQRAVNKERRSRKSCMFDLFSNCKIIAIRSAKSNISNLATIKGVFHWAAGFYEFVDSKSLALSFVWRNPRKEKIPVEEYVLMALHQMELALSTHHIWIWKVSICQRCYWARNCVGCVVFGNIVRYAAFGSQRFGCLKAESTPTGR